MAARSHPARHQPSLLTLEAQVPAALPHAHLVIRPPSRLTDFRSTAQKAPLAPACAKIHFILVSLVLLWSVDMSDLSAASALLLLLLSSTPSSFSLTTACKNVHEWPRHSSNNLSPSQIRECLRGSTIDFYGNSVTRQWAFALACKCACSQCTTNHHMIIHDDFSDTFRHARESRRRGLGDNGCPARIRRRILVVRRCG